MVPVRNMLRIWKRFAELRQRRKRLSAVAPFIAVFLAFVNTVTLRSFVVGFVVLIMYMVLNGDVFGRVFFADERPFFRLVFGLFAFMVVLALAGVAAILVFTSDLSHLLAMVFAAGFSLFLNVFFVKYQTVSSKEGKKGSSRNFAFSTLHVFYGVYVVLLVWSFLILFGVRSGWVQGPIWNVIAPSFLYVYFAATAVLVGIVLLSGKVSVRLLLIVTHSVFSLLFIVIVSFPGIIFYDPWYDLGRARALHYVVQLFFRYPISIRSLNSFLRGFTLHSLVVDSANMLGVDMYWTYVFILPVLWGFFVPPVIYRITEMMGGSKKTSVLAAFLTIPNLYFLAWGKLGEASSLAILFFIFFVYLVLRFLSFPVTKAFLLFMAMTWITIGVTHFLPAVVAVCLMILAIAFKLRYRTKTISESSKWTSLLIPLAFLISLLMVPTATVLRGLLLPMLGTSSFSLDKLLGTDIWALVFGISPDLSVQKALLYEVFPLFGLIGAVYVLQKPRMFKRNLCLFLFLVCIVLLIDFRILEYAIVGGIFGAGRLSVFRDISALPFVAVAISLGVESLVGATPKLKASFRWRSLLGGILVAVSLSAWTTAAVYETYEYYTTGLMPTSLEVEAIKYIDEHTNSRYIVFAPHRTVVVSWGFVGIPNPDASYLSVGRVGVPVNPTIPDMFDYMRTNEVDQGFFIVTSFGSVNFNKTINEALKTYGLFKVISDGSGNEVYIFYYKIPPLPTDQEVNAFYWDTPPAYYIQSDLVRVIINPLTQTLDITDFFGGLSESIEFKETLVDGSSVGNLTLIEYFNATSNQWIVWEPSTHFSPLSQFQFKLRFEKQSLFGIFSREDPPLKLWWESGQAATWRLRTGDLSRIYIPGLIDDQYSYNVNSREYGFLYTFNLTDNVILHPINRPELNVYALTYAQILNDCNFNLTQTHLSYDLYIENTADIDQWVYLEVRLPDKVYTGTFPPLQYSLDDGKTWIYAPYNVELKGSVPIITYGGTEINWFFTIPKSAKDQPTKWWSFEKALGGSPIIQGSYIGSGGAQNRMIYGFFLPERDKILVRVGISVYYARPLETSYVFTESSDVYYGLYNMERGLIKFYNIGSSESVVGLASTALPTALSITQNEADRFTSVIASFPANATLSLLSRTGVNTAIDLDEDGIPDLVP